MEKTIYIDEKPVRLRSTAALPKRYKAQFRRDYFADLLKISKVFGSGKANSTLTNVKFSDLDYLDMDVLYDIIWTMAKSADKSIPDPMEWLDGFEKFPLQEIMTVVQDLLENLMPQTKKKYMMRTLPAENRLLRSPFLTSANRWD